MFSLTRAKYIEAMESATNLVWTLCLEKANLFNSEQNLSANWYGKFADENLRMFRNLLQRGAYDMSISYANGMVAVMEEYLPEIDKMMAKREKIAEQLEQDWYVEPDLSSFCEEMLILDYDYIEGIKADGEGAVYYGDKAIEILTEMIEEVNACASEYVNLSVVEELLATGKRKLHRIDNFIYEFVDFARKMSDMEYNMSQDLSMRIIKQNEEDVLSNGAGKVYQDFETRTEQIGEGYESLNYYETEKEGVTETIKDYKENVLIFPKPGEKITISRGIDLPQEQGVVFTRNTWTREYSVNGCNKKYAGQPCCKRLNFAIENYESNYADDDLLMFSFEGYDKPVYAGAMVEGFADIGDIVEIILDNGDSFNFLILDVKSTKHTSKELAPNNQCQCEWGHGYVINEENNTVQLSICEFITAGSCDVSNVQNTKSGAFLKGRSVEKAQIKDHIYIGEA